MISGPLVRDRNRSYDKVRSGGSAAGYRRSMDQTSRSSNQPFTPQPVIGPMANSQRVFFVCRGGSTGNGTKPDPRQSGFPRQSAEAAPYFLAETIIACPP